MKRIYYIFSIIFLVSCSDMLDEKPKDFVSRSNYYQSEADAQGALNGAYGSLNEDFYGITQYLMVELHGDYLNGRGSQAPISLVDRLLDQQSINRAGTNWARLYQAVNRANAVLDNVSRMENISDNARTRILGEAHFLRALAYFELVRGWGAVPLKLKESTDLSVLEAPRVPEEQVYAQIIEDAKAAETALGEVGAETGRASKWSAKMLLAHAYLTTGNWALAAEKADDVINSGIYALVKVTQPNDFYNIYAAETSSEDIMSVHHSENVQSYVSDYLHLGNARPYNYNSTGYYAWVPDLNSFIGDSWDDADLRKTFNFYREYQNPNGNVVAVPAEIGALFKKFITTTEGLRTYSVPIYRYTEAFLFYAEAACRAENGPSALALERLNKIKRRAYGFDPDAPSPVDYPANMSHDQFIDTVLQERAYEFLLERRRWFDLKRTGKIKDAFAAVGKTYIDERLLFPIPENEINNNPAISQEDQNPGY